MHGKRGVGVPFHTGVSFQKVDWEGQAGLEHFLDNKLVLIPLLL